MLLENPDIFVNRKVDGVVFYRIQIKENGEPYQHVCEDDWGQVVSELRDLGYKIRESGYSHKDILVYLDREISPEHIDELSEKYEITEDSGLRLVA